MSFFWNWVPRKLDHSIGLWLMVFSSVERYMFIFHSTILQQHAIILRYLPIAWCLLEPSCFYIILILFPPGCQNIFHPGIFLCAVACVNLNPIWLGLEMQLHIAVPVFLIIISNLVRVIRVFQQKRRMQQRRIWTKNMHEWFYNWLVYPFCAVSVGFLMSSEYKSLYMIR